MNANIFSRKIEMTKAEAKAAGKIGSEKFKELHDYMEAYPGYEIQIKATPKRKVELKGLDYKYMRNYIQKCEREDKGEGRFVYEPGLHLGSEYFAPWQPGSRC